MVPPIPEERNNSALTLVLDQGGHSSRALVFAVDGTVVAQAAIPVATQLGQPGWVEQNPAEILASLHSVITQVANQLGARVADLHSAGLIVQRASLLAWHRKSGEVFSPVLSWQDTRNCVWLDQQLTGKREVLRQKTGLYPNAHYGASKICWLLDHVPTIQQAAVNGNACIAPLASFLHQQLTHSEAPVIDAVIAARTLLTECGARQWSDELLQFFSIPFSVLPKIMPTVADYGFISVADTSVPLRLLGGDQSFFTLANPDFFDARTVFINAGTGAFVQQAMSAERVPIALLSTALMISGDTAANIVVAECTVNAAASALDWLWQREGKSLSPAQWQQAFCEADAQPSSVPVFISRMVASGSPDWLPAGNSVFSVDAAFPLQAVAVLESVIFALQRNLDQLASVAMRERIVLSGGLSLLEGFCQRLADLAQVPVYRSSDVEACARGAAMQLLPQSLAAEQTYQLFSPAGSVQPLHARYRVWTAQMDALSDQSLA
jgi:glycerol kinase